eukprot:GHVP01039180.1.p1 GENE.GHVP01039180.1~~GHVP01039180.1.p1  ORF type:complete len:252 (+),score=34.69 GHVP01039180.1:725-1480(+)
MMFIDFYCRTIDKYNSNMDIFKRVYHNLPEKEDCENEVEHMREVFKEAEKEMSSEDINTKTGNNSEGAERIRSTIAKIHELKKEIKEAQYKTFISDSFDRVAVSGPAENLRTFFGYIKHVHKGMGFFTKVFDENDRVCRSLSHPRKYSLMRKKIRYRKKKPNEKLNINNEYMMKIEEIIEALKEVCFEEGMCRRLKEMETCSEVSKSQTYEDLKIYSKCSPLMFFKCLKKLSPEKQEEWLVGFKINTYYLI